jgi:sugar/nucleoside kinase (ribokinase family)
VPAFKNIDVVDTTGAGDVFHGAYLFGLIKGWDSIETAKFACAVSAITCTRLGGRAGIPQLETVLRFLKDGYIDYTDTDKRAEFYEDGIFNVNLSR